ncbi:MAG: hypothetical protein KGI47_04480 [Betaproteobacteria bacterium]|nr:hypothetical protein [Betaproteobacteria bacterium]MDE2621817.1 hypothetical protein [Betaproteobacteria bacterium]
MNTSFRLAAILSLGLCACSSLLPTSQNATVNPWSSYQDMQRLFDGIVPHKTTVDELKTMGLDPHANPNIVILNYSDILRHFIPSPSINAHDLDQGVQECIQAKTDCEGYEINQSSMERNRYGNFLVDFLNFKRKTDVVGWRFNGIVLIKNNVVIYKLTGGEPSIHKYEEHLNPLGPFQIF